MVRPEAGWKMNSSKLKACLSHWQVILMLILIVGSVIAIGPRFEDGKFTTNLQYGLELQEGTWLQMEFKAEIVGFETDLSSDEFVTNLEKQLDADIYLIEERKLEIRSYYPRETLETAFTSAGGRAHIV